LPLEDPVLTGVGFLDVAGFAALADGPALGAFFLAASAFGALTSLVAVDSSSVATTAKAPAFISKLNH
jgi:hypothetical protein